MYILYDELFPSKILIVGAYSDIFFAMSLFTSDKGQIILIVVVFPHFVLPLSDDQLFLTCLFLPLLYRLEGRIMLHYSRILPNQ